MFRSLKVQTFDYIVVGAGTAGCVIAARLTESGRHSVALIEAGGEDNNFWIHVPIGYGKLYDHPKYNWLYETEPEPELGGTRSYQPRGKVIGGTGAINGMVYMRGQREDYDHWRQLGNIGWSYDDVLPYFRKSEDNARGGSHYHGVGGPIRVIDNTRHELGDAFLAAAGQAGFPLNADHSGAAHEGFGYTQMTVRNGRRCNSAVAFLYPARKRPNLQVITNALVKRIVMHNRAAVGVEFQRGGAIETIRARGEIILCGGAFNSPQVLQASGIGPAELLHSHGVPVTADLPGVGAELQDHFGIGMAYRCSRPITVNDSVNNPVRRIAMGLQYLLFRRGLMATNATFCIGYVRTDKHLAAPNVGVAFGAWARAAVGHTKSGLGLHKFSGFTFTTFLLHPDSRGSVRIKSADTAVAPEIRFNFFRTENDHETMVKAIRSVRRIASMPALTPYIVEELTPGASRQTDEELISFCRGNGRSTHHAGGTCKMGTGDNAVVDPRLRVRGITGLRVADASIMPRMVGGNTNAPIVMIAEKGSAMILEDSQAR